MVDFWKCFIPLLVAMDALGILPIYCRLTEKHDARQRQKMLLEALLTATGVAAVFLLWGPNLLKMLGIEVSDFMIAGGILLFTISISDLLSGEKRQRTVDEDSVGAVPIGVPLITGPAVLTTTVLLRGEYGIALPLAAIVTNVAIVGAVFWKAHSIKGLLGQSGSKAISKIASMLLAAIGVMLVRRGIQGMQL